MTRLVLFCALSLVLCSLHQAEAQTARQRAALAVDQMQTHYSYLKHGTWSDVGWWHSANCLTALCEFCLRTGNQSFDTLIEATFVGNSLFFFEGYDDEGWWALGWLDAYQLTGAVKYLDLAELIYQDMSKAVDNTCGGGIWWDRKKTYKNAITNELYLSIAARLYLATKSAEYLQVAQTEWKWFQASGMINSQNLINDGLTTSTCTNNGQAVWTYNQGVILGGLVALYTATQDASLITEAEIIANATIKNLVSAQGILEELCDPGDSCNSDSVQFKGIFIRNLAYLYEVTNSTFYGEFILNNANSLWSNDKNGNSFGAKWTGPFDSSDSARQSSALDLLNAAMLLEA